MHWIHWTNLHCGRSPLSYLRFVCSVIALYRRKPVRLVIVRADVLGRSFIHTSGSRSEACGHALLVRQQTHVARSEVDEATDDLCKSAKAKRALTRPRRISSDTAPIANSSTPAPPLPLSFLHPHLNSSLKVQSQDSSPNSWYFTNPSIRHSPPAIRFPRVSCHPPQPPLIWRNAAWSRSPALKSKPGLSDDFLASLDELPSANPGISDAPGVYGPAGGSTFDRPTGLG
jgi:hypothetical protein